MQKLQLGAPSRHEEAPLKDREIRQMLMWLERRPDRQSVDLQSTRRLVAALVERARVPVARQLRRA
jgi:hypothetical protein